MGGDGGILCDEEAIMINKVNLAQFGYTSTLEGFPTSMSYITKLCAIGLRRAKGLKIAEAIGLRAIKHWR